jgi:hypothetical protein
VLRAFETWARLSEVFKLKRELAEALDKESQLKGNRGETLEASSAAEDVPLALTVMEWVQLGFCGQRNYKQPARLVYAASRR